MKILYLHQYFTTPTMSGGTRSYEMARRMVNAGHEVHIITSWRETTDHKDWFYQNIDGIHVHWLPVNYSNKMSFNRRIKAFFQYALKASSKAKSLGGDIVFATSTPLTIAIPGVRTAKALNVPMVFEVRDLWPELPIAVGAIKNPLLQWAAKQLEKYAYRNAAHIVALSPGMAEGVTKLGYPKAQVSVISNSADLELFHPEPDRAAAFWQKHPELSGKKVVLYAGTLGLINGVSYLAELAAACKTLLPDVAFVVIGDGMEREKVTQRAEALAVLNHNFFMYSPIPKAELIAAFHAASVSTSLFVELLPMEANSANKFFDGLASGTAIAINYGGWQEALLTQYQAGFRLSRDVNLAATELATQLANSSQLAQIAANARQLAEQEFNRDVLAKQLIHILETVGKVSQPTTQQSVE